MDQLLRHELASKVSTPSYTTTSYPGSPATSFRNGSFLTNIGKSSYRGLDKHRQGLGRASPAKSELAAIKNTQFSTSVPTHTHEKFRFSFSGNGNNNYSNNININNNNNNNNNNTNNNDNYNNTKDHSSSVNLSHLLLNEEESIEGLWKLYNKAKDSLPYKTRMENLTWRMMFLNTSGGETSSTLDTDSDIRERQGHSLGHMQSWSLGPGGGNSVHSSLGSGVHATESRGSRGSFGLKRGDDNDTEPHLDNFKPQRGNRHTPVANTQLQLQFNLQLQLPLNRVNFHSNDASSDPGAEDFDYVAHIRKMGAADSHVRFNRKQDNSRARNNQQSNQRWSNSNNHNQNRNHQDESFSGGMTSITSYPKMRTAPFSPGLMGNKPLSNLSQQLHANRNHHHQQNQHQQHQQQQHHHQQQLQQQQQHQLHMDFANSHFDSALSINGFHDQNLSNRHHNQVGSDIPSVHASFDLDPHSSAFEFSLDPLAYEGPNTNFQGTLNPHSYHDSLTSSFDNPFFDDMMNSSASHIPTASTSVPTIVPSVTHRSSTSLMEQGLFNQQSHSNMFDEFSAHPLLKSSGSVPVPMTNTGTTTPTNLIREESLVSLPEYNLIYQFSNSSQQFSDPIQQFAPNSNPLINRSQSQTPIGQMSKSLFNNDPLLSRNTSMDFTLPSQNEDLIDPLLKDKSPADSLKKRKLKNSKTTSSSSSLAAPTTTTATATTTGGIGGLGGAATSRVSKKGVSPSESTSTGTGSGSGSAKHHNNNNKTSKNNDKDNSGENSGVSCSNCHTKTTPLWRRNPQGQPLCNACGLFLKLHGTVRPLSLKTDVIKKRQRGGTNNGNGGASGDTKNVSDNTKNSNNYNNNNNNNNNNKNSIKNKKDMADGDDLNPTSIKREDKKSVSSASNSTASAGTVSTNSTTVGGGAVRKRRPSMRRNKLSQKLAESMLAKNIDSSLGISSESAPFVSSSLPNSTILRARGENDVMSYAHPNDVPTDFNFHSSASSASLSRQNAQFSNYSSIAKMELDSPLGNRMSYSLATQGVEGMGGMNGMGGMGGVGGIGGMFVQQNGTNDDDSHSRMDITNDDGSLNDWDWLRANY